MVKANLRTAALVLVTLSLLAGCARAQRIPKSQHGTVSQTVADTRITVEYNRPVARGRRLFGGVVRYGETWNPGADDATRLEFTRDVLISGQPLPAGKYSLWAIPREDQPWTFIFSRDWDVFHVPYPGAQYDALRIELAPEEGSHMEVMAFYFPEVGPDRAVMNFHWGETVVRIPIRLDD